MKRNTTYLLLIALLGLTVSASVAQQNQNTPKPGTEVDALKNRVSELENKLQTVENVEKMELAAKLADAQAKLLNAEIGKLKLELKDFNQQWLITWIIIFLAFLSAGGLALWSWLTRKMDDLIANEVEKSLNGFKEAVEQVKILKGQLEILQKKHAASVLENFNDPILWNEKVHPEQIKALTNEVLLNVFDDSTRDLSIRVAAIEVLAARNSESLVSSVLTFLNTNVDSDINWEASREPDYYLRRLLSCLSKIHYEETYQGLKHFLNRLMEENPKHKNLFLTWNIFSLAEVGLKLDMRDSISILKSTIPELKDSEHKDVVLDVLIEYFEKFNGHEGIKDILTNDLTDNLPDKESKCLKLLQDHYPDFVREWKNKKEDTNTESEESS